MILYGAPFFLGKLKLCSCMDSLVLLQIKGKP